MTAGRAVQRHRLGCAVLPSRVVDQEAEVIAKCIKVVLLPLQHHVQVPVNVQDHGACLTSFLGSLLSRRFSIQIWRLTLKAFCPTMGSNSHRNTQSFVQVVEHAAFQLNNSAQSSAAMKPQSYAGELPTWSIKAAQNLL